MSLAPIINALKKHAGTGAGAERNVLGALKTEDLIEIANSVLNYETGALNAIRTVGDLISCYSKESGEPDRNGSGWTVVHLAEALDAMLDLKFSVIDSLNKRGLDQLGRPLASEMMLRELSAKAAAMPIPAEKLDKEVRRG